MDTSMSVPNDKPKITVKSLYSDQGKDFKDILENVIKSSISSGNIEKKLMLSDSEKKHFFKV